VDSEPGLGIARFNYYVTMNRALVILSLASTAVVAHLWTRTMDAEVRHEKELQTQNDELAAREEEIARQMRSFNRRPKNWSDRAKNCA